MRQVGWKRVFNLCGLRQHAKVSASLLEDLRQFLVIWERNEKNVGRVTCTYAYVKV